MNTSVTQMPNSKAKLQERLQAGRINWAWPVIIVFARLIFAILAQALVAGLFMLQGHQTPWQAAAPWWPVYGTLIDISCLVLLAWLARREGIRLFDLISFQRQRLGRDLLLGVGLLVSFIILSVAWGMVSGLLSGHGWPSSLCALGGRYNILLFQLCRIGAGRHIGLYQAC